MDGWNISFLLGGWLIFRCYVWFQECTSKSNEVALSTLVCDKRLTLEVDICTTPIVEERKPANSCLAWIRQNFLRRGCTSQPPLQHKNANPEPSRSAKPFQIISHDVSDQLRPALGVKSAPSSASHISSMASRITSTPWTRTKTSRKFRCLFLSGPKIRMKLSPPVCGCHFQWCHSHKTR